MIDKNTIPEGWKRIKIKEIGKVETGSTPSKNNPDFYSDEFPFYKPTDLQAGYNVRIASDNLSKLGIKQVRFLPENSILVTCIGATIGKSGIIRRGGASNQQINAIIPLEEFDPNFIYYQTIAPDFQKQIKDNAVATTLPILNKSKFQNLEMVVCSFNEQQEIVDKIEELLSELDKGKEQLETARQQLKVYRQAVLKWAFEGKLTNPEIKEGELPEGWKFTSMGEIIEKPKYGTSKKCEYEIKGIPVLRIPNIGDGVVDTTDLKFAAFEQEEVNAYKLNEGDILTIRSNGSVDLVGKCALITKKEEEYLYAGYLIRLRPLTDKVFPKFLLHVLSSSNLRNQIESKAKSTSGVNNINTDELKSLILSLPPLKEQKQIVQEIESRLSVCDKVEETITQSLQQAKTLRQSILKQAFEGKLITNTPRPVGTGRDLSFLCPDRS